MTGTEFNVTEQPYYNVMTSTSSGGRGSGVEGQPGSSGATATPKPRKWRK